MIIGFRRWRVGGDGMLRPLYTWLPTAWLPGSTMPAQCCCSNQIFRFSPSRCSCCHKPCPYPNRAGNCGYYSYRYPIMPCWCETPFSAEHDAVGVVKCWGKGVEYEYGWRMQYAQILAVVDFTGRISGEYGASRYPDLETLYSEWAPNATVWARTSLDWCALGGRILSIPELRYGESEIDLLYPRLWVAGGVMPSMQVAGVPHVGTYEVLRHRATVVRDKIMSSVYPEHLG